MKNKKLIALLAAAALILVVGCFSAVSADNTPGSASDPVVTKSYVDKFVSELRSSLSALESKVDASGSSGSSGGSGDTVPDTASASFKVVQVGGGSKLLGAEGTEVILRSGSATAVDNATNDGIADLTDGSNLNGGTAITKNHLMLIPREDGRGIACSTDCYVMVKGGYTIE
jgi:hypothetical protein